MLRFLLSALLLVFASSCRHAAPPAAEARSTGLESKLDAILTEYRERERIPALAFALVKDDQVLYLKAFGERDLERHLPATVDTLFGIGSCTKAFTALAAAIAQDENKVSLDDHPRRFLKYFRMADPEADAQVTLRDLLSHRSGLAPRADLAAEPAVLTRAEYVRAAASAKPVAPFRSAFSYSNAGYSAVGEVLGAAYGSSWEQVIQEKLLGPLDMKSSRINVLDKSEVPDHAIGYRWVPDRQAWTPVPPPRSLVALAPGGSIASTARDMVQWLRLLIGSGELGGKRLVSERAFRELTRPHIQMDPNGSYALGWAHYEWDGLEILEHSGGSSGLSAFVSFIPERRVGFVLLASTAPGAFNRRLHAAQLIYPMVLEDPPTGPAPTAIPSKPVPDAQRSREPEGELPEVKVLLARMLEAVGGDRALRRHQTLSLRALKRYENHGVEAALTVRARAEAQREDREVWTAAGREIARIRVYFDGQQGGQETTFGQDARYDAATNETMRIDWQLHPLLTTTQSFSDVSVESTAQVNGERAWVLRLRPPDGAQVRLWISADSALILQRETRGQRARFDDYRWVDGERVAFMTTLHDALGETTIQVQELQFNQRIPAEAFEPER